MSTQHFAFVRSLRTSGGGNLKSFAQIRSAEAHAKREDLTSTLRQAEGRSHADNYFWSKCGEGLEGGGADYTAAYREHKKDHGVKSERKGAAIGMHLLVGVSPEWLSQGGDPRDLNNKKVQELISHAKDWAESWMGKDAVWAVRYDTDETGAGIVDILASPIREQKHKNGSTKPAISVAKPNAELAAKHGVKKSYEAMQTDWAKYAQQHLDQSLKRGTPVRETGREHVSPETFKAISAENEALRKELDARSAEQDEREKTIKDGWFDRLTKKDPSAAKQIEDAQHALKSAERLAERRIETANTLRRKEVASAESRASEALSSRSREIDAKSERLDEQMDKLSSAALILERRLIEAQQREKQAEVLERKANEHREKAQELSDTMQADRISHAADKAKLAEAEKKLGFHQNLSTYLQEVLAKQLGERWEKIKATVVENWQTDARNPYRKPPVVEATPERDVPQKEKQAQAKIHSRKMGM